MNIKDISVFLKYKSKWPTMEIHNLLDVKSRTELREWLIHNHKTEKMLGSRETWKAYR